MCGKLLYRRAGFFLMLAAVNRAMQQEQIPELGHSVKITIDAYTAFIRSCFTLGAFNIREKGA
jgi:hypothetical protein